MSGDCPRPLEPATLVDYWFGDAAPAEEVLVEEHLLECDACGGRLRALLALGEGVRRAAHEGRVHVVVTPLVAQPMPAVRAMGPTVLRMRLLAQEGSGERLLGEYTFAHTPTRG